MTKQECRKLFREKRKQLSSLEILKYDDLMLIHFQKLELPFLSCVHTYLSIDEENEIDTFPFIGYLKFRNPGMIITVPKIDFKQEIFHQVMLEEETELLLNRNGIAEPVEDKIVENSETDLAFIPLISFDSKGNRVGYGKGFYDKFLSTCRSDLVKIGLCYFDPTDEIQDVHQFDISLNYCITPQRIYEF